LGLLCVATVAVTIAGWLLFWFLTDDAFILFRYVRNGVDGQGLVWNPAPFRPVEGYTSFLWVILLMQVWLWLGIEAPDSSTTLSLLFGLASLLLMSRWVLRLRLPAAHERARVLLLALALLATVSNRTFLAWLSSGLETSMFNFAVVWWLYIAWLPAARRTASWSLQLACAGTMAALTRPDGMLFYLAGLVTITVADRAWRRSAVVASLAPVAHLIFRWHTYGELLPNTYYAKVVAPWPQSGSIYLASFLLEYALWLPLGFLFFWLAKQWRVPRNRSELHGLLVTGPLLAYVAWYTLIVGGDHFEYRVFSYWVFLVPVGFVAMTARLLSLRGTVAVLTLWILLSLPIPWTHWALTRNIETRQETLQLFRPIAEEFPAWLRPAIKPWDSAQKWLVDHFVGLRHQEHKIFASQQFEVWSHLVEQADLDTAVRPVIVLKTVGVPGWLMPDVAVLDMYGLNDYVIARNPVPARSKKRLMAHERISPPGYVRCYRPNMRMEGKLPDIHMGGISIQIAVRRNPLTDDAIRACDRHDWTAQ
jgi:arabinofuranosyltransferase